MGFVDRLYHALRLTGCVGVIWWHAIRVPALDQTAKRGVDGGARSADFQFEDLIGFFYVHEVRGSIQFVTAGDSRSNVFFGKII